MKVSQLALVSHLLGAAVALPYGQIQDKRAIITATIWETINAPDVMVYVDENGATLSMEGGSSPATPAPQPVAPAAKPPPAPAVPSPAPHVQAAPPAPPAPVAPKPPAAPPAPLAPAPPAPPAPAPPAPPAPPSVNILPVAAPEVGEEGFIGQGPSPYGVTWTGYKGTEDHSDCKTFDDADQEWSQMGAFSTVRIYGADCEQPNIAFQLGKKYNKKVFLGVYWLDGRLDDDLRTIIKAARASGRDWSMVDTISIGNEDVHRGGSPVQVFAAVAKARVMLRAAGYRGPIVHVDSQDAILAHPELCSHAAGDYIASNIHAFFNPQTPAENAGDFVATQVDLLKQCGSTHRRKNVRVRVTETGWPKAGEANGAAVPSKANQNAAVASIKKKLGNDVFLFSAFNNYWMKNNPSTFNAEHYWGVLDN